jgi:hypothetical protein
MILILIRVVVLGRVWMVGMERERWRVIVDDVASWSESCLP